MNEWAANNRGPERRRLKSILETIHMYITYEIGSVLIETHSSSFCVRFVSSLIFTGVYIVEYKIKRFGDGEKIKN